MPCQFDRFPVVESFEFSELLSISFDKIGEFVNKPRSLKAGDILPPSCVERCTCRVDCDVDILGRGWKKYRLSTGASVANQKVRRGDLWSFAGNGGNCNASISREICTMNLEGALMSKKRAF